MQVVEEGMGSGAKTASGEVGEAAKVAKDQLCFARTQVPRRTTLYQKPSLPEGTPIALSMHEMGRLALEIYA